MHIYFKEISLHDGFKIAALPKNSRIVAGREIALCAGIKLFISSSRPITCYNCDCSADRWIMGKGKRENGRPTLNLFGTRSDGKLLMMTRDHIIPRSMGGLDLIENLRPACEICNNNRGSEMSETELAFLTAHPELVGQKLLASSILRAAKHEAHERGKRNA
jgi:hypothetical protein